MLLTTVSDTNMVILNTVKGAKEFMEELMEDIFYSMETSNGVTELELFGIQVLLNKEWTMEKTIANPYWRKEDIMKQLNFILDGKPKESYIDDIDEVSAEWDSTGRDLTIYDLEKGRKLVTQLVFGIGDIPVKQQKYLLYLLSKLVMMPEEATPNDVDQLMILYRRFKNQYMAA